MNIEIFNDDDGLFCSSNAAKQTWTELEEDELKALFMEHQQNNIDEGIFYINTRFKL